MFVAYTAQSDRIGSDRDLAAVRAVRVESLAALNSALAPVHHRPPQRGVRVQEGKKKTYVDENRHHERDSRADVGGDIQLAQTRDNGVDSLAAQLLRHKLQSIRARAADDDVQVRSRQLREQGAERLEGGVDEDAAADGEAEDDADELGQHHEGDGVGGVGGRDNGLDRGVAGLDEGAGAEGDEDLEAVDLGDAGVLVDLGWE